MTPEQARKLLEGTSPALWEAKTDQVTGGLTEFWVTDRYDCQVAEQEALGRSLDVTDSDFNLIAAAPGMANMIAGMTTEYVCQYKRKGQWETFYKCDTYEQAEKFIDLQAWDAYYPVRIATRYVTAPQPLGEHR